MATPPSAGRLPSHTSRCPSSWYVCVLSVAWPPARRRVAKANNSGANKEAEDDRRRRRELTACLACAGNRHAHTCAALGQLCASCGTAPTYSRRRTHALRALKHATRDGGGGQRQQHVVTSTRYPARRATGDHADHFAKDLAAAAVGRPRTTADAASPQVPAAHDWVLRLGPHPALARLPRPRASPAEKAWSLLAPRLH